MIRFFAVFFLVTMILNVTLPLVEQLRSENSYELVELDGDEKDDETKSEEKESEGEKEKEYTQGSLTFSNQLLTYRYPSDRFEFEKSVFCNGDLPLSALYTILPELPPEL